MLISNFFLAAALNFVALGQASIDVTSLLIRLPSCSLSCSSVILEGGCSINSELPQCLCTNITLQFDLGSCLLQNCNTTEVAAASSLFQQNVCVGFPKESRSEDIIVLTVAAASVTGFFVVLRLVSRRMVTNTIHSDDWAFIFAAVLMVPTATICAFNASHGFGQHFWDVPPENITLLRKLYYVSQIIYILNLATCKFAILLLYHRIFTSARFRVGLWIAISMMILHHFTFTMVVVFQCNPIKTVWSPEVPGKCLNTVAIIYAGAAFNIIEDIIIMALPVGELTSLKLDIRKRIALGFLFASGSAACITSMVRLKFIITYGNTVDSTWDNVDVVLWSTIEIYAALICACFICLRPLAAKLLPVLFRSEHTAISRETPFSDESNKVRAGIAEKLYRGNFGIRLSDSDMRTSNFDTQQSHIDRLEGEDMNSSSIELGEYKGTIVSS
ncbi:hypothetical protein HYFRA_00011203 [Hymenoscyphus fraxineus]|uniref:Extracellular membrane protein CFEM domain-containing protein n=1 Tax=Hymenoscyphus fraxineus TaxID=746836 RepID=A0A9N9L0E1_9HELO|nr:hypothetical protein HYFRA_00011203 [Hymenoscyphus fraxineus]